MAEPLSIERCLEEYGTYTHTNVGTSMMPALRQGRDVFTVERRGEGRCVRGEVVLFRRDDGAWVLHRVVEVLPEGYLILGDNCLRREYVAEDKVVAVMRAIVREGRTHSTDGRAWRLYTSYVLATEPVRLAFLRTRALVARCKRALTGMLNKGSSHA